jgi:hypothetical protein
MKHKKTIISTFVALLLTISLSAQQPTSKPAAPAAPVKLTSTADTVQYTLGAYLGQWMVKG